MSIDQVPDLPTLPPYCGPALPNPTDHLQVPHSKLKPYSILHHQIQSDFNPLSSSYFDNGFLISLTSFVGQHLQSDCQFCLQD